MATSPDFLTSPVGRGAGVRRLNRRPLAIAGLILCLLLLAVSYTYQMRLADQRRLNAERTGLAEPVGVPAILKDAPETGLILPHQPPARVEPAAPALVQKPAPAPVPEIDPYAAEWAEYRAARARQQQTREQATLQAIQAPTALNTASSARQPAGSGQNDGGAPQSSTGSQLASLYAEELRERRRERRDEQDRDLNRAAEKRTFLSDRAFPIARQRRRRRITCGFRAERAQHSEMNPPGIPG